MTFNREEIQKIAEDAYYLKAEMVKYLLVDNLALKTLLLENGVLNLEEFEEHRKRAAETLEARSKEQMTEQLKALLAGGKDAGHIDI